METLTNGEGLLVGMDLTASFIGSGINGNLYNIHKNPLELNRFLYRKWN